MIMSDIALITYSELLDRLEGIAPNHLLLGNGFNNSLSIRTCYKEIFSGMKNEYSGYGEVESLLRKEGYDIEKLISYLKEQTKEDSQFLNAYIERKVKMDFMKAANEIIQGHIKKVYQEKNQGIYLLLRNFTNYFTLNYDPLLYLLLLKFKKNELGGNDALAIQNTTRFIEEDLDTRHNLIYQKIKDSRKTGQLQITVNDEPKDSDLGEIKKSHFVHTVKEYFKNEGWKSKDIERVCDYIWKKESNRPELDVQDGFSGDLFGEGNPQNLYFLHGSFQLTQKREVVQKITAKQNKAFLQRLEEAVNSEDQDIICVLTGSSQEKERAIQNSAYLRKCFNDLSKISGTLVILGSSLSDNDKHIFNQINISHVQKIYVSSCEKHKEQDLRRAEGIFKEKEVVLFDYNTISYRTP